MFKEFCEHTLSLCAVFLSTLELVQISLLQNVRFPRSKIMYIIIHSLASCRLTLLFQVSPKNVEVLDLQYSCNN